MAETDYFATGRVPSHLVLPVPSSLRSVPKFAGRSRTHRLEALEAEASLVKAAGLSRGTYRTMEDMEPVIQVHDQLWTLLERELQAFDRISFCKRLYEKIEIVLAHMHLAKYQTAGHLALESHGEGSEKRFEAWRVITPFTEGMKFLLEMAVKHCRTDGLTIGRGKLDFLIEIASEIVMIDGVLDTLAAQIMPFEIIINENYLILSGTTREGQKAIESWTRAAKPHAIESDKNWIDALTKSMGPVIEIADIMSSPELQRLDTAMVNELGYGFVDWLNYVRGCIDYFESNEWIKAKHMERLRQHVSAFCRIETEALDLLLHDHSLSVSTVQHLSRNDMMPMENYGRDSRLLRRPLLNIPYQGGRIAILGIETFTTSARLAFNYLDYGVLQISRLAKDGPVKSALGLLQSKIGEPFRESIANKCQSLGFQTYQEHPLPGKDRGSAKVGPVDVFVIDHRHRRFVLVEAKNLRSSGLVPNEMKAERDRFLNIRKQHDEGFLDTLEKQRQRFISNMPWHLADLGLEGAEDYQVEAVVVVRQPMFWPRVHPNPLPILDDLTFYRRLRFGEHFLSEFAGA